MCFHRYPCIQTHKQTYSSQYFATAPTGKVKINRFTSLIIDTDVGWCRCIVFPVATQWSVCGIVLLNVVIAFCVSLINSCTVVNVDERYWHCFVALSEKCPVCLLWCNTCISKHQGICIYIHAHGLSNMADWLIELRFCIPLDTK